MIKPYIFRAMFCIFICVQLTSTSTISVLLTHKCCVCVFFLLIKPCRDNRNVSTGVYSSFTDSQYFFGSQFWPENSQGASQDMSLSSRNSQQSSSEVRFISLKLMLVRQQYSLMHGQIPIDYGIITYMQVTLTILLVSRVMCQMGQLMK